MLELLLSAKDDIGLPNYAFPIITDNHNPNYLIAVYVHFIFQIKKLVFSDHSQQLTSP